MCWTFLIAGIQKKTKDLNNLERGEQQLFYVIAGKPSWDVNQFGAFNYTNYDIEQLSLSQENSCNTFPITAKKVVVNTTSLI